jgi:hypothetical protein
MLQTRQQKGSFRSVAHALIANGQEHVLEALGYQIVYKTSAFAEMRRKARNVRA